MATRGGRCGYCGAQLLFPNNAESVQCPDCGSISLFHQENNIGRGLIGNVPSNINYMTGGGPVTAGNRFGYPRPVAPLKSYGRKRAVLCGVSYYGKRYRLKGSINDVKCMEYFLVERMGFPSSSVIVLSEQESDPNRIPTKHNILAALRWLVHGVQPGDSLVFHYSGHGSKEADEDMDEIDGYDECICPVDYKKAGKILDDEINSILVRPLPRDARLLALIDSCYSGTVLDLHFLCRIGRDGSYKWEDQRRPLAAYKGTSGGVAVCISACDDQGTSSDTTAFTGRTVTGAMTYSFIQAMERERSGRPTYGHLLNAMRVAIHEAKTGIHLSGPMASLASRLLGSKLSQEPQLSSSETFDPYSFKIAL
ncbi:hypothetical protein SAY86_027330 [Trapa natans]|uniref:Peptidase C14 caspase domain-containing protein n=1 Tax=Trapa natans TaxID=22666 RepID=A0AAN7KSV5_TRANT|nr:hypothetical protein SAY86_027330 [Trapa natans]